MSSFAENYPGEGGEADIYYKYIGHILLRQYFATTNKNSKGEISRMTRFASSLGTYIICS